MLFGPFASLASASAIGSWVGGVARPCYCECTCHFSSDNGALKLLEKQLDRCGPEHLCPVCAVAPTCQSLWPVGLGGFAAGAAATLLLGLGARSCRPRAARGPAAHDAAPGLVLRIGDAPGAAPAGGTLLRARSVRGAGVLTVG